MTKTFEIPFKAYPENIIYKIKVTDKQEERDGWKRVYAINKAEKKFNAEHCTKWTGSRFLIISGIKEL